MNSDVDRLIEQMDSQLMQIPKAELLKRLVSQQLEQLMLNEDLGAEEDLNVREGRDKSVKEEKKSRRSPHDTKRFFINLGQIDGLTKADLVHFVSDITELDRGYLVM